MNQPRGRAAIFCSFLLASILFQPFFVQAAQWTLIAATDDLEIEVDKQSAKPRKGAWFKYIRTPPTADACGYGKKTAYAKSYVEANCNEFTIRVKQSIAYGEDGDDLPYCSSSTPKAEFTEFAPETVGELYFNAVCQPSGRTENAYAAYLRQTKRERDQSTGASRGVKPFGAECSASAECEGTLLCGKKATGQMRCMTSAEAWRSN